MSEPPHVLVVGNVNVDMIMGPLEPWPQAGTEVVMPEYELRVGGSAGNAALALAALGVPFRLLANAGDDVLGHWLRDSFGAAAEHWRLTEMPTTVSVVSRIRTASGRSSPMRDTSKNSAPRKSSRTSTEMRRQGRSRFSAALS